MVESQSNREGEQNPYESANDVAPPSVVPQTLSVPLLIGLVAIIIVVGLFNWGLGISLLLVAVPAYVRAIGKSVQKLSAGETPSTADRILAFMSSVLVVGVCAVAGGIGFFSTCLTVGAAASSGFARNISGNSLVSIVVVISGMGFFGASGVIYWVFWPRRTRK